MRDRERGHDGTLVLFTIYYSLYPLYACVQTLHSCQCPTDLCNKNWVDAGSTENPDGPTDKPTEPAVKPVKVETENITKEL